VSSKSARIATWTLAGGVALVFGQSVFFGFITFDDGAYVFLNRHVIRGLSWDGIVSAFTAEVAGNWHPLTILAHMGVSSAVGPRPWAYHLLNVAIHAANCVLLLKLLQMLLTRGQRSFVDNAAIGEGCPSGKLSNSLTTAACWFATGLFALHPLRVESVVWISELKDLLSALFWLLTIRAYLTWVDAPIRRNYLWLIGYFAAGLMSKPMVVTLPCVLLLLDCWPLKRIANIWNFRRLGELTLEKLPLFAMSAAICLVTVHYQKMGDAVRSLESFPFALRVQSALVTYVAYLGKTIWPVDLALFYPYPKQWPVWAVAASAALILLLTLGAVFTSRRFPAWFTGWFWYLGTLIPVIGLVQVGQQSMADRYTYIPSMGIILVIAWAVATFLERCAWRRTWLRVAGAASIAILGSISVLTWRQTNLWRTSEALYRHTLRITSGNWFMHQTLAVLLAHTGRVDEGIKQLREALVIVPDNASVWDDLGYLLQLKGEIPDAIKALEEAIRLDPRRAGAHRILAAILRQKGETRFAIEHLREAIHMAPKDQQPLVDLAHIRASHPDPAARDAEEAVMLAQRACELSGYQDPDALDALAAAYAESQQFDLALDFARRGVQAAEALRQNSLAERIRKRITLYEMRMPFREAR
jgi:protein O-mannosyl-transferase